MNKKIRLITAIAFIFISKVAFAVQREDVLECGLPNGDKFILISKYDYSLAAKLLKPISRHPPAERFNVSPYKLYLRKNGYSKNIEFNWALQKTEPEKMCARFGSVNDLVYAGLNDLCGYLGETCTKSAWDEKLRLSYVDKENPTWVQMELKRLNLRTYPGFGANTMINKQLVREQSLSLAKSDVITAVWQATSTDNGKTWADPIITTDAKIFELGKTIYEQSFIARPISINGKKIEAHFPPPPDKTKAVSCPCVRYDF